MARKASKATGGATVSLGSDVWTRIATAPDLRPERPALVVHSLKWDSDFRRGGLQPGDRIVAVDGAAVATPATTEEAQSVVFRMVGQVGENQAWAEAGRVDGDTITLRVLRRKPPEGWEALEIEGELRADRSWRDADNQPVFGPGGPRELADDGFPESWSGWLDRVVAAWTRALGWRRQGMVVSDADVEREASATRVASLAKTYPGPFADAIAADWSAVEAMLDGYTVKLGKGALAYRTLTGDRIAAVRKAGETARKAFLRAHKATVIPAFPAIDPLLGDRNAVAGKLVELPAVSDRAWVRQGERSFFVFDGEGGSYTAEITGSTEWMVLGARRYERIVAPLDASKYEIVARVLPRSSLVATADRARFALGVEPVAATVGDAFFIDLSEPAQSTGPPAFAGEADATPPPTEPPGADTPPVAVAEAMFAALKAGDVDGWRQLFADWTFFVDDAGKPVLSPWAPANLDANWELGRRRILDEVVDVRVAWADDPVTVHSSKAFTGAPNVEQVLVEVDHFRMDGEKTTTARSFAAVGLTRLWALQRLEGGPWRVATNAAI